MENRVIHEHAVYSQEREFERVGDHHTVRVDNKPAASFHPSVFIKNPVGFSDFTPGIRQHRKWNAAVHHFGKLLVIPHFVNEHTVNTHGKNFDIQFLEFGEFFSNC